jgi:nucleotide-binding universal stress UspA family protein
MILAMDMCVLAAVLAEAFRSRSPLLMAASLIVLTDFFKAANRALDYATNLAEPLGARLVLLHVRRDSILDPEMFTSQLSNLSKEAIALALNSVAKDLAVPVVAEVGHGLVASAAADAASRNHPAIIVLGRPDFSDVPDEVVQTTCLDLLRLAPYPMLVVPHSVAAKAPPRRVLVAVDGEPFKLSPTSEAARHLLSVLKAELTVLHVELDSDPDAIPVPACETVIEAGLAQGLDAPLQYRKVVAPRLSQGILAEACSPEFDLLILIARHRSFFGNLFHRSVTAHVLLHSTLPVLVLPAQ